MSNGQIQIPFPYTKLPPTHIKALVQKIRTNFTISTHKKNFVKYENCFIGNELVSFLLSINAVPKRRDAIEICRRLFEARLIVHVKDNEMFKDDKELYHLIDPVAGTDLMPSKAEVERARTLIAQKGGLPKYDNGYKNVIKFLSNKGFELSVISRAICLERYKINNSLDRFPQTSINQIKPKTQTHDQNVEKNGMQNIKLSNDELVKMSKKIVGILKYVFNAADQSKSNDLDLTEFAYLLSRLGIKVSHKGAELLFRAMLSNHNKQFLGFYEFKIAFSVSPQCIMQFIKNNKDSPAKILKRHIRSYYERVAEAHKANRNKISQIGWSFFSHDKDEEATMNFDEFRIGIRYLGLDKMTNDEILFLFESMNRFKGGRLQKERFCHEIKKDIPVSLSKVVNVKDILFDSFERILNDYKGQRSVFPTRERHRSVIEKKEKKVMKKTRKSIFQRMKSIKTKRRKTVKAPIKSAFGSNVAEIAENGREIMDDIISSMVNENGNGNDDNVLRQRSESAMISADEFKKLFNRAFFPKTVNANDTKQKPVNIKQLSITNKLKVAATSNDSKQIEKEKRISIIITDDDMDFDEEEKENIAKSGTSNVSLHSTQKSDADIDDMTEEDEDESYSPPLPSYLSTHVLEEPPWMVSSIIEEEEDNGNVSSSFVVDHTMISPMNSNLNDAATQILNGNKNDTIFDAKVDDENEEKMIENGNDAEMILLDELFEHESDDTMNGTALTGSSNETNQTMMKTMTPTNDGFESPIVKMQKFRILHEEQQLQRKKAQDEEYGLSFNETTGNNSLFEHPIRDSDDSLELLQKEYERELLLKDTFKLGLFNGNIDDIEDPHPKDLKVQIETTHILKPSIAKKITPISQKKEVNTPIFNMILGDDMTQIANNPPQINVNQMNNYFDIDYDAQKKQKKYSNFLKLPPIPGVICLKSVKCSNLIKGKMRASETYYLRVYEDECENVISFGGHLQNKSSLSAVSKHSMTSSIEINEKIKELKSKKHILPRDKSLNTLPSLIVIKSYPVFAKKSEKNVIWQNLPASISKDAKLLTVGIYMKRERELVLIGSAKLAKNKKNLIPKQRIGIKQTSLFLTLSVPEKYKMLRLNEKEKSTMQIEYSFCPKQFCTNFTILSASKVPLYSSKIPIICQLLRLHLLKVAQEDAMTIFVDEDSESDIDDDEYKNLEERKEEKMRFYEHKMNEKSRSALNELVGNINSGHYKLDNTKDEIVWFALLRWFREIQPNALLHSNDLSKEFVDTHNEITDDEAFRVQVISLLMEPFLSLFLWSIDLMIVLSEWYRERIEISTNKIIDTFVPNLFGFDVLQKHKLFLNSPNAYSFVLRVVKLRKNSQFKLS